MMSVHAAVKNEEAVEDLDEIREEKAEVKPSATPKEERMLAALTTQSPCAIAETFYPTKTARKSAVLSLAMRRSLAAKTDSVIMFTSAYAREGATSIAFQAARSAAMQSTGRVLYVHLSRRVPKFFKEIEDKIPLALDEFAKAGGGNVLPFVVLEDSGLVCASFQGPTENINEESLRTLLVSLRSHFDLIVFGGDEMLSGGTASAFSDLVDGTILVTEAERTRAPVAKRLKRTVEDNGGKVIGAILNRRKYHIPGWIYRIMYGGV